MPYSFSPFLSNPRQNRTKFLSGKNIRETNFFTLPRFRPFAKISSLFVRLSFFRLRNYVVGERVWAQI